jgi:hypothetical protein
LAPRALAVEITRVLLGDVGTSSTLIVAAHARIAALI